MKTTISGHIVDYDESMDQGIRYLKFKITPEELKVFFDEAYYRGHAAFRDHLGYNYRLVHDGGEYQLERA